jgi:ABC-type dipeptide/oligopeptide/nickel transport system permease component
LIYAATLALKTFSALMSITAFFALEIYQADAVNAFLNSTIDKETFIEYPEGYSKSGKALRLLKALYGLKQSPLLWYNTFIEALTHLGLKEVPGVNCLLRND